MQNELEELVKNCRYGSNMSECCAPFLSEKIPLKDLLEISISGKDYPIPEYSSWMFVHVVERKKELLLPIQNQLIDSLFKLNNQSQMRNFTKALSFLEVTEYKESELLGLLIGYIQNSENKVALQVYSMRILAQFVRKYPELENEIIEIIEINQKGKTNAYHSGYRRFLREVR